MIIRNVISDGRDLLQRIFTPVLREIEECEVFVVVTANGYGENSVAIGSVTAIVNRLFPFGEVLTYLKRHGKHHIVYIKERRALKRTAGCMSHYVDISIRTVALYSKGNVIVLVGRIGVCYTEVYSARKSEEISSLYGIVSLKLGSG